MGLDIRFPIGMMFTSLGIILSLVGLLTGGDKAMYERSLNININLVWGVCLLVFGALMWLFAVLGKRNNK